MKASELIAELSKIISDVGDLEIYEEILDGEENTGIWYSVDPVVRCKSEVKILTGYDIPLPDKFISLE